MWRAGRVLFPALCQSLVLPQKALQRGDQYRTNIAEFVSRSAGLLPEKLFSFRCDGQGYLATVSVRFTNAFDKASLLTPVGQFHHAVVVHLHAFGKNGYAGHARRWQTFNGKQQLVLLRMVAAAPGVFFHMPQVTAKLVPEFGKRNVLGCGEQFRLRGCAGSCLLHSYSVLTLHVLKILGHERS